MHFQGGKCKQVIGGQLTATAILQRIAGEDLSSLSFLSILIPEYKLKLLYFTKSRAVQKRSQWEGGKLIRFSHNTPHNTGRCFLPLGHCGPKDAS